METHNWIDDVLQSTKGMQKAEPSPFLFEQITARINKGEHLLEVENPLLKWGLTCFVLIMLSLNVISIVNNNGTTQKNSAEELANTYFNTNTTYNY